MPTKTNTIVGLDIGTSKIAVVIGQIQEGIIHILGTGLAANSGLRRGAVVDIEDTVSAISAALEEAERTSGLPLTSAYVGVGGSGIQCVDSKGVVAIARADGEITESDIERVLEAARTIALPPNHEILHVIPKSFTVDGQTGVKDPIGMSGIRLEVDAIVIGGVSAAIRNLTKCVAQAGLDIDGLIFGPLATARGLLTKKQRENGAVLVDFGAGTTSLAVFEEGSLLHAVVLPVGSNHITNDIAIGLKTSLEVAEQVKIEYANANPENVRETDRVDLGKISPAETEKTNRRYIAEITEARLREIFQMIKKELKKINREGMLPAGVVLTGGGSQLTGLADFAKEGLHLPAQIGYPILEVSGMVDKLDNPVYATSTGLLLWGVEEASLATSSPSRLKIDARALGNFPEMVQRAKSFLKQFLP